MFSFLFFSNAAGHKQYMEILTRQEGIEQQNIRSTNVKLRSKLCDLGEPKLSANDNTALESWSPEFFGNTSTSAPASANRRHQRWSLITSDLTAMSLAVIFALMVGESTRAVLLIPNVHFGIPQSQITQVIMLLLPVALLIWSSHTMGHYTRLKPLWSETKDFFKIIGYTVAVIAVVLFLSNAHFSRIFFIAYWSLILFLVPTFRYLTKLALIRFGKFYVPVVVFGIGVNAVRCARTIESDRMLGLKVVSFVDPTTGRLKINRNGTQSIVENFNNIGLEKLNEKFDHPHYVFALDSIDDFEANRQLINSIVGRCRFVTVSPPVYGLPLDGAEVINVQPCDSLLVRLQNKLAFPHSAFIKRTVDIVGSSIALLLTLPVFIVLVLLIKRDGGPVFFKQVRIGRDDKTFNCWKFRSMVPNAELVLEEYLERHAELRQAWEQDHKLKDDPRVTFVGNFIRKGSIDELPQLWNVLKGDMSLVGPRPIVYEERMRYGEYFDYYMSIRPGITGLWQISGRNDTTYKERVDLDVWYSRNWSLWLDVVIIVKTVPAVLFRSGAY